MDFYNFFETQPYDDVYSLDVIHSIACLQSSVEIAMRHPFATIEDLERIKDQAEEVVEIAMRLQSHFPAFSSEFAVTTSLKDKVVDLIIIPVQMLLSYEKSDEEPKELWRKVEMAFMGPLSLSEEVRHLERFLY
ncbi:MAG: hypothetical protein K9M07_05755 [Simkaniaceae bacterium]|nr:hypothetical protein [Simkaniaceae bacterium]